MANTFPKQALKVRVLGDAFLAYAKRRLPEGASQTFVPHAPLVLTSGYLVEAASPVVDVWGFALGESHNTTAGAAYAEYLPAIDGVEFFANFLGASAVNNAFAITDLKGSFQMAKSATLLGPSRPGWYVVDTGTTAAAKMVSVDTDHRIPTEVDNDVVHAGDTNARPSFVILDSIRSYG